MVRFSVVSFFALAACAVPTDTSGSSNEDDETTIDPAGDEDGDGLTNAEEDELGTDWQVADSDGDGFSDGEEVEQGTNPLWTYSHLFEEGDYVVGNCPVAPDEEAVGATGKSGRSTAYQDGDVVDNVGIGGTDSYKQEVSLYSFCGNYTLVTLSAEWCGPCQALADTMQEHQKSVHRMEERFTFFELIYQDNNGETPDANVLKRWRNTHDLEGIPVVAPADQNEKQVSWFANGAGIPATTLLAPDMTVLWSNINHPDEYYLADAEEIKDLIRAHRDGTGE